MRYCRAEIGVLKKGHVNEVRRDDSRDRWGESGPLLHSGKPFEPFTQITGRCDHAGTPGTVPSIHHCTRHHFPPCVTRITLPMHRAVSHSLPKRPNDQQFSTLSTSVSKKVAATLTMHPTSTTHNIIFYWPVTAHAQLISWKSHHALALRSTHDLCLQHCPGSRTLSIRNNVFFCVLSAGGT